MTERGDLTLDRADLDALAAIEDPLGVVSMYVDADPAIQSSARPAWAIELDQGIAESRRRLRETGSRDQWIALERRLDELAGPIARLADPAASGRGRALFVTLSDGRMRSFSLRVALPTRVVVESRPHLRPLVAVLDRWRPMGLAAVSRDGMRILDMRMGTTREIARSTFAGPGPDWREMKGPAAGNPASAQQSAPQHDRFGRRVDERRGRFLVSAAADLGAMAADQGWDLIVAAGDQRLTRTLIGALPAGAPEVHESALVIEGHPADGVAEALSGELAGLEERRRAGFVRRALEGAHPGGRGALGPDDTRAALAEGRVERLLLADEPGDDGAGEQDDAERMTERALATGARVTPLDAEAAGPLREHSGVAALLRW